MKKTKFTIEKMVKRIGKNLLVHHTDAKGKTGKNDLGHFDHLHIFYK